MHSRLTRTHCVEQQTGLQPTNQPLPSISLPAPYHLQAPKGALSYTCLSLIICLCACINRGQRTTLGVFPSRQVISLDWSLPIQLDWLAGDYTHVPPCSELLLYFYCVVCMCVCFNAGSEDGTPVPVLWKHPIVLLTELSPQTPSPLVYSRVVPYVFAIK